MQYSLNTIETNEQAYDVGGLSRPFFVGEPPRPSFFQRAWKAYRDAKVNAWVAFFLLTYVVLAIVVFTFQVVTENLIFGIYTILIPIYIFSRFLFAYLYEPPRTDYEYEPTVSFVIPCKNEGDVIATTIRKLTEINYPKSKYDVVVINDGSTDNTLAEMYRAKEIAEKKGVEIHVIDWQVNRGKRAGMAEGIRRSTKDIVVFIDSDSFMDRNALYHLVKYFMDKKVGAVAAHTNVYNKDKNILTRMQAVRYYVDFRAYKAAEALFGRVTCCPGCCSAYRREYLMEVVDEFEAQRFLGARCDYSDDRSLTNFILAKGHKIYYAPEALAYTIVPETFSIFHKQQLRWNKAWLLETYRASLFMWKFNPIFSISFYIGSILSIATPFIVLRALVWVPLVYGDVPLFYITGIALMAVIYSLYYYIYTDGKDWIYGVVYATVYAGFLSLQMIWAVFKLRDARWGTR